MAPTKETRIGVDSARGAHSKDDAAKKAKGKPRGKPFEHGNVPVSPGRPRMPEDVKQAAREVSIEAIKILTAVMRGAKTREADKIRAAEVLLNRAWGTPPQSVALTDPDGVPLVIQLIRASEAVK